MTTAVETNVFVGLWDRDPSLSAAAQRALDAAERASPARGVFSPTSLSGLMPL
jgi:hypothetical protein